MADINEPNYVHYSRLKTINLDEAASLLAHFELRNKNVTDPEEYAPLFNEEKRLANQVLYDANMRNSLDCFREDGIPTDIIYYYKPELVMVNVVYFCKWANDLNYDLPKELLKIFSNANHANADKTKNTKTDCTVDAPKDADARNKGGKPKGYLSEVVGHVYQKLSDHGKSGLSKPSKIREFIIFMKEMATKSSRYADEFVMERIKSIRIPEEGDCIIITEENIVTHGLSVTTKSAKPHYTKNDVSKILTSLRKNNIKTE
jgi:hypothetical protein